MPTMSSFPYLPGTKVYKAGYDGRIFTFTIERTILIHDPKDARGYVVRYYLNNDSVITDHDIGLRVFLSQQDAEHHMEGSK